MRTVYLIERIEGPLTERGELYPPLPAYGTMGAVERHRADHVPVKVTPQGAAVQDWFYDPREDVPVPEGVE